MRGEVRLRLLLAAWTVGGALVLLAGLELAARVVLPDRSFSRADFYGLAGEEGLAHISSAPWGASFLDGVDRLLQPDRRLLWTVRPDLDLEGQALSMDLIGSGVRVPWKVRTDGEGRRITETVAGSGPHVVALGDSSTFGWGVDRPFLGRLQERTGARATNLAVPGYSAAQGLAQAREELAALAPDHVLLAFGANDAHDVVVEDAAVLAHRRGAVGGLLYGLGRLRLTVALRDLLGSPRDAASTTRVPPEAFDADLRALIGLARESGARPVLVSLCANDAWDGVMGALHRELAVPLVRDREVREAIDRARAEGAVPGPIADELGRLYGAGVLAEHPALYATPDGCHPSSWAHQLLAERLAEVISAPAPAGG